MSDLHELSASQQLRALRAGEVSSRDLTEHYLARIEQFDAALGTFVTVPQECPAPVRDTILEIVEATAVSP